MKPIYTLHDLWKSFVMLFKNLNRRKSEDSEYLELKEPIKVDKLYGDTQFENIVDKDGHKRFVEGDLNLVTGLPAGITKIYGKWSLSGTHLMLVLVISLPDTTTLNGFTNISKVIMPSWIYDKIVPVFGSADNIVSDVSFLAYGTDGSNQSVRVRLFKDPSNTITLQNVNSVTATADRKVRVQFDLLIDND